ncbi:Acetyltransferase (GNAT) family protein [Tardiphaga sp. OK246]|jgi:GNAT superfamily N-acetyltransferase|uniref:GNAT family N-acetyltransferase n=1 Tax=Tardiphaga sp. OK246 TaxID=1855307 RepID=UPI000B63D68F|nr:GNAT family N-acetyltransferase [Tardiphaga sp. OK246]SNT53980.1 Acetyltransferase (GNAT) family protein [Tardiphaga sp. OK246]
MPQSAQILTTRKGIGIKVRPVAENDEKNMQRFFYGLRPEDLRFRFLTGMKEVSAERIHDMTHVDHQSTETYIAFIEGDSVPVATAMLATDTKREQGEVAISVRADHRAEGIGWELLVFVSRQAAAKGLRVIQSIESRDNHDAIVLEREIGFKAKPDPDDARLVILSKAL